MLADAYFFFFPKFECVCSHLEKCLKDRSFGVRVCSSVDQKKSKIPGSVRHLHFHHNFTFLEREFETEVQIYKVVIQDPFFLLPFYRYLTHGESGTA